MSWISEPDYTFYFESSYEKVDTSRYIVYITRDGRRLELHNGGKQQYMTLVKFKFDTLFTILTDEELNK